MPRMHVLSTPYETGTALHVLVTETTLLGGQTPCFCDQARGFRRQTALAAIAGIIIGFGNMLSPISKLLTRCRFT